MADLPVSEIAGSPEPAAHKKGQFGVALEPQVTKICGYALLVGCIGGLVAQGLLELIYLFTNIFFFGCFSFAISHPAANRLGLWVIAIPAVCGLVVRLLIYFFEPTLKGHGIPQAMEAVLFGHSRMRLRVAILKPLATALAIGTGGPFGAEAPIIQTGGAIGPLLGHGWGFRPITGACCWPLARLQAWRRRLPRRWRGSWWRSNSCSSNCGRAPSFPSRWPLQ